MADRNKPTPAEVLKRYRKDAERLKRFSEFTRLTGVERMALDCFEALKEALGSRR